MIMNNSFCKLMNCPILIIDKESKLRLAYNKFACLYKYKPYGCLYISRNGKIQQNTSKNEFAILSALIKFKNGSK